MGFQIGDRVVTTVDFSRENVGGLYANSAIMRGKIGTVVTEYGHESVYGIEFDEMSNYLHSCDGSCREGHGWFASASFLEKVSDDDFDICVSKDEFLSIIGIDNL